MTNRVTSPALLVVFLLGAADPQSVRSSSEEGRSQAVMSDGDPSDPGRDGGGDTSECGNGVAFEAPPEGKTTKQKSADRSMKPFSSAEGGFRVNLPGDPTPVTQEINTPTGKIAIKSFLIERPESTILVTYYDFPQPVPTERIGKALDATRDSMVADSKGTVVNTRDIKLDDIPGREFMFTFASEDGTGKEFHRQTIYLKGARVYQVTVVGKESMVKSKVVDSIFSSFTVESVRPGTSIKGTGRQVDAAKQPGADGAAWRTFSYKGTSGGFSIRFPTKPERGEEPGVLGARKLLSFTSKDDTLTYIVQIQTLPAEATAMGPKAALDATRDALLKATGGKLLSERKSDFGDEGRRLEVQAGALMIRAHSCVRGNILYDLAAVGPSKDAVYGPDAAKFFKSFGFTKP